MTNPLNEIKSRFPFLQNRFIFRSPSVLSRSFAEFLRESETEQREYAGSDWFWERESFFRLLSVRKCCQWEQEKNSLESEKARKWDFLDSERNVNMFSILLVFQCPFYKLSSQIIFTLTEIDFHSSSASKPERGREKKALSFVKKKFNKRFLRFKEAFLRLQYLFQI